MNEKTKPGAAEVSEGPAAPRAVMVVTELVPGEIEHISIDLSPPAPTPPETLTVEAWAAKKNSPAWLYAAARAFNRWAQGAELTETEFDAALAQAGGLSFH